MVDAVDKREEDEHGRATEKKMDKAVDEWEKDRRSRTGLQKKIDTVVRTEEEGRTEDRVMTASFIVGAHWSDGRKV